MKLPNTLNPSPIIDAIVELRFSTTLHHSAVFGVVYNKLKDKYHRVTELPILQLPEQLRDSEESLKDKPYYIITSEDGCVIQVGPRMIAISSPKPYIGWSKFQDEILQIISKILELNIIDKFNRISMRYIDFFKTDIFDKIMLEVNQNGKPFNSNSKFFRTEINIENLNFVLQISNSAQMDSLKGSVIDIDAINSHEINSENVDEICKCLVSLHNESKQMFFSLLKEDFLSSLNPSYE